MSVAHCRSYILGSYAILSRITKNELQKPFENKKICSLNLNKYQMKKIMRQVLIIPILFFSFNAVAQRYAASLEIIKDPVTLSDVYNKQVFKSFGYSDYKVPDLVPFGLNDASMAFRIRGGASYSKYALKVFEDTQYKGDYDLLQLPTGLLLNTKWAHSISSFKLLQKRETDYIGGNGGHAFDEGRYKTSLKNRIATICIWSGGFINAIRIDRINEFGKLVIGEKFGGNDGKFTAITLQNDEYITRIGGRSGVYIDKLIFYTNKGKVYELGGNGGSPFPEIGLSGSDAIKSISGRCGVYLDGISFWGYSEFVY